MSNKSNSLPSKLSLHLVPWLGLLSVFGVFLTAGISAWILVDSNGKATESWPMQKYRFSPTVLLSIMSAFSRACLALALSEAFTICWWRSAKRETTISGLHNTWGSNDSIFQAIMNTMRLQFHRIAFGKILVAIAVVQGPLAQRGSWTTLETKVQPSEELSLNLRSRYLTNGFSGIATGGTDAINLLADAFIPAARDFNNRASIPLNYTGCNGTCSVSGLIAPGFDLDCHYDRPRVNIPKEKEKYTRVFNTEFEFQNNDTKAPIIKVIASYKGQDSDMAEDSCSWYIKRTTCYLREALVRYDATLTNGTLGLSPVALGANATVQLRTPDTIQIENKMGYRPSTIGGIYAVAKNRYASERWLSVDQPGSLLSVHGDGSMGMEYLNSHGDTFGNCNMTWSNPMPDILNALQELIMRAALEDSSPENDDHWQNIRGQETRIITVYQSDYKFIYVALMWPILAALAVFINMWGWWDLAKKYTFSPIEIGKALDAPLLASACWGDEVADMLENSVGDIKVRYTDNGKGGMGFVASETEA